MNIPSDPISVELRARRVVANCTPYAVRRHNILTRESAMRSATRLTVSFATGCAGLLAIIILLGAFAP